MNKKFGIGILIVCFGASSVNMGFATEVLNMAPIVVQPYDNAAVAQQLLDTDRKNRDQEIQIQQLSEANEELSKGAHHQGMAQIETTMKNYRDALYNRDRERILTNGQWRDRYGDLVKLTQDTDAVTIHQDLVAESGMLTQKYLMLTALKDEMTTLNDRLSNRHQEDLDHKQSLIDGFEKLAKEQQDKIQMLVNHLDSMDKKINDLNALLMQKEEEIVRLRDRLSIAQNESSDKDLTIKEQTQKIAILEDQAKTASVSAPALSPIIVNPPSQGGSVSREVLAAKDAMIKEQQQQIRDLRNHIRNLSVSTKGIMALTPIVVNPETAAGSSPAGNTSGLQKDALIRQQQSQIDLLKSELENKITQLKRYGSKNQIVSQQLDEITELKSQAKDLSSKVANMQAQADALKGTTEDLKNQNNRYEALNDQLAALKSRITLLSTDLKNKNQSIDWLNKVVAATRTKAHYYQLISDQDKATMQQVDDQIRHIHQDFNRHYQEYGKFESAINDFKSQINMLSAQLTQKQGAINSLQNQLNTKEAQAKSQALLVQQQAQLQDQLRAQLQDKENQIAQMRADIQAMLQAQAQKEIYHRRMDDRIKLARELVGLQNEEASLLDQKSNLEEDQNSIFDKHFSNFEYKMKGLEAARNLQTRELNNRLEELNTELQESQQQAADLQAQMLAKISQEKNQTVLAAQIQDLNSQLQNEQQQIASMKAQLGDSLRSKDEADSLRQQLAAEAQKSNLLKAQLDDKIAESQKMNAMMGDYQHRLESKNNAYNQQLGTLLTFKNYQAKVDQEIANLNTRLQAKEAQVVNIRKSMYELQQAMSAKDTELQEKDLSLSMVQEKTKGVTAKKDQDKIDALQAQSNQQLDEIKDLKARLALATDQLNGMPSTDEIEFLRAGLKKATMELKVKNALLMQTKTSADEYAKEFKKQSVEFLSLKDQLQEAQDDLARRDEDVKYKDLAIARLKVQLRAAHGRSVVAAAAAVPATVPVPEYIPLLHGSKVQMLEAELENDNGKIKALQNQVRQLETLSDTGVSAQKLKQALDKIDEQGRIINVLAQKLQDYGHSVNLSQYQKN